MTDYSSIIKANAIAAKELREAAKKITNPIKNKRKSLSKRTRFNVFKRDGFTFQYCEAHPPKVVLHVDHIVPVVDGGSNEIDNLVTSCEVCNLGKGGIGLNVIPQSLSEKAAEIHDREEQIKGYESIMAGRRARLDDGAWKIMGLFYPEQSSVPRDSFISVKRFIERIGFDAVFDAAEIALIASTFQRNKFKYFCGVCWNKIQAQNGNAS